MIKFHYFLLWCFIAVALAVTFGVLYYLERKKTPCVPAGCPGCENITGCHTSACTASELANKVYADPQARKEVAKGVLLDRTDELLKDAAVLDALANHPVLKGKFSCPPKKSNKTLMIVLLVVGGLF
jgi:hypothetical protein